MPFYFCSRIISNLEENEAKLQTELKLQQEFKDRLALLTASYVEYLDEDFLFQQLFSDDEGRFISILLCIYIIYLNIYMYSRQDVIHNK